MAAVLCFAPGFVAYVANQQREDPFVCGANAVVVLATPAVVVWTDTVKCDGHGEGSITLDKDPATVEALCF